VTGNGGQEDRPEDPKTPLRRCLVTGESRPKPELVRFVIDPEGTVVPDVAEELPGRGLWLSASRSMVEMAGKRKAFARAARRKVTVPEGLADTVARQLAARCVETLGLARRSGQAVSGFERVAERLRGERAGAVFQAVDGAVNGRRRIRGLAADAPVVEVLTAAELGQAMGRERAVHVFVGPGRLAERLRIDGQRLAGFRDFPETADGSFTAGPGPADERTGS